MVIGEDTEKKMSRNVDYQDFLLIEVKIGI